MKSTITGFTAKRIIVFLFLFQALSIYSQDLSLDKKLGEEGKAMVESSMGFCEDPERLEVIKQLGSNLTSHLDNKLFDYQFYLVDMGEPNAFALPGGYIFVTRGILALANTEDELAGVIGHEIIHSNNRHSIKQQRKGILPGILAIPQAVTGALFGQNVGQVFSPLSQGGKALMASHSRKDENEADKLGTTLAANSGYNPASLAVILNNLNQTIEVFTGKKEKPSYFADHPLTVDRIKKINKESAKLIQAQQLPIFKDRKSFLSFIDGMLVGPNPKQGIFQGNWFLHPEMDFKFKTPDKWIQENSTSAVATGDTTGLAIVMLELETEFKTAKEAAENYALKIEKKSGKPVNVETKNLNGFTSKSISFKGNQKNQVIEFTMHWIEDKNLIYRITGASVPEHVSEVKETIESFSRLTDSDRNSIKMKILKVVETQQGEDLKTISDRTGNVLPVDLIAAVNGINKDKIFVKGELVKVVITVPYKN
ncbi:MAG: M48 family metalloprotease [Bacteroidales bacterium]